jgi:hypothetical protein
MSQESTPESAGSARPFRYYGKQGEFTLLAPFKPGGAAKAREIARIASEGAAPGKIGTLHNVRIAILDNDTRMLFASVYDGNWDDYIDDFAAGSMPFLDQLWFTLDGYPGLQSSDVKDYLVKYQVPIGFFWTAYPDSTVDRIQRGERVLAGLEQVLDAAG